MLALLIIPGRQCPEAPAIVNVDWGEQIERQVPLLATDSLQDETNCNALDAELNLLHGLDIIFHIPHRPQCM